MQYGDVELIEFSGMNADVFNQLVVARCLVLPELMSGTADLQLPVTALQALGDARAPLESVPVPKKIDPPWLSVIVKGKPSWIVVTPEMFHPLSSLPLRPSVRFQGRS